MVGGLGAAVVGTPEQVADEFERWVEEADVDGFKVVSSDVHYSLVMNGCGTDDSRHTY